MTGPFRPLVISAPEPRSLDLIFSPDKKQKLFGEYEIVETKSEEFASLPEDN